MDGILTSAVNVTEQVEARRAVERAKTRLEIERLNFEWLFKLGCCTGRSPLFDIRSVKKTKASLQDRSHGKI